jgi:SAM-dependent methyltransferase
MLLTTFLTRFVADLGATAAAGNVVVGGRLGLYRALADGPLRPAELAFRTGTAPRYVEEWLHGQAAGGYVEYHPADGTYSMTAEQAFALTDPDGPVYLPGAFQMALGTLRAEPQITEAFRTGEGLGPRQHDDVFLGLFPPGYLITSWLPALDGMEERLRAGARVADVGCRLGTSTILMAGHYPRSTFAGFDQHSASIDRAGKRAGIDDRVAFSVRDAQSFDGGPYDLVTTFNSLHDMGDPLAAAKHIRGQLKPSGAWMIVEPFAGETVADNLNPVGRLYYSFSTFLCVPNALSQPGGYALGAQAGEEPIRRLVIDAGFARFHRVAETPFHLVYEARLP